MIKQSSFILYKKKSVLAIVLLSFVLVFFSANCSRSLFTDNVKETVFTKLEKILEEKKSRVLRYLEQQREVGENISKNEEIVGYFKRFHQLYRKREFKSSEFATLERKMEEFYVYELDNFYDVLFIDNSGIIFFTVKKEKDFLANINDLPFKDLALSRQLNSNSRSLKFVDYEYYSISDEPASFFIAPVLEKGNLIGKIVLQLPINKINTILTDRRNLGRTGEVYLVNEKQLMLTQSRFIDEFTVLRKKIDTKAVKNAIKEGKGNRIIEDYRGKRVFSSYEKFNYEGITWIIIVEMDEDEIITDLYKSRENEIFDKICEYLANSNFSSKNVKAFVTLTKEDKEKRKDIKVDVKEFMKSKNGELLYTSGVSTCTALTISYPGHFGYLVHITPTDEVYNISKLSKTFLRDEYTNFVDAIMYRMNRYDIYQYEKEFLRFGIFAVHNMSAKSIFHKLIDHGIELSQIKFIYRNNYDLVNVRHDYNNNQVWSQWEKDNIPALFSAEYEQTPDLEKIVMKVLNYDG